MLLRSFLPLSFLFFFGLVLSAPDTTLQLVNPLEAHPRSSPRKVSRRSCRPSPPTLTASCFPALGFKMPSEVPANTNGWWCDPSDEYAFMGFSYEITSCQWLQLAFAFSHDLQVRVCPSYRPTLPTSEIPSIVVTSVFMAYATTMASSTAPSSPFYQHSLTIRPAVMILSQPPGTIHLAFMPLPGYLHLV